MSAAVTGEFGAQITLLIHQEKLDAPRGAMLSLNAKAVWGTLADVAHQLLIAWGERFRKLCPEDIDASALVTAACRGKLSVATLVPAGSHRRRRRRCARLCCGRGRC